MTNLNEIQTKIFFWVIAGKRNSGKTTLVLNLLKSPSIKNFYSHIVILKNSPSDEYPYKQYNFSFDSIDLLLESQKNKLKKGIMDPVLIIFDDCFADLSSGKTKEEKKIFSNLVYNGRHYLTSCCVVSQYLNLLESSFRSNIDRLYLKQCYNANVIERFLSDYLGKTDATKKYNYINKTFREFGKDATFMFDCEEGELNLYF